MLQWSACSRLVCPGKQTIAPQKTRRCFTHLAVNATIGNKSILCHFTKWSRAHRARLVRHHPSTPTKFFLTAKITERKTLDGLLVWIVTSTESTKYWLHQRQSGHTVHLVAKTRWIAPVHSTHQKILLSVLPFGGQAYYWGTCWGEFFWKFWPENFPRWEWHVLCVSACVGGCYGDNSHADFF